MTALLHRRGFVYKKPKLIPGKADAQAQQAFVETNRTVGMIVKEVTGVAEPLLEDLPCACPVERIELLRRKGLMVSKDFGAPAWLHKARCVDYWSAL